ncbi:helix-turn-helix transcriptional regulator [Cellulomonas humilata]|uniref:Helix-turn-helix transcriptional regulator n=1 Tax=Cellulomonas humilata TaxID=144055 RepID=A0A7Y6A3G7_9CELL|nr:helix-turn-helix domain-containing protein [Cellulomonas humilata]NUU19048.1 helix-turn-helix transcriptional regulator [Cellulomonas humilata]
MRTSAPALIPIFRSTLQAQLLLEVLSRDAGITAADLARLLDAPAATVSREVRRLLEAGLLRADKVGRAAVLQSVEANPATAPLRQLLTVTLGPWSLMGRALATVRGIDEVYIHGSWAARYLGLAGRSPADVDVVVIGSAERREVDGALEGLESRVGREINVTYVSPARWAAVDDPGVATLRAGPLVRLAMEDS